MLTPRHVKNDQTREEYSIDFRVPGLSHSVVKEAEHLRVQELAQRIETHPHRAALEADLQQNNVYNPFIENWKQMIRELGNVDLFELCETTPKVQCSQCLLYWNQGIVYCTCGQCLIYSEPRRKFNIVRMNAISIPDYVIKKDATHGAQHGKTDGMRGRDAVRKSTPKVNILHVFTIDFSDIQFIVNHNSQSDGQNKSAESGMNLRQKIMLINSLQRKGVEKKDNGILI